MEKKEYNQMTRNERVLIEAKKDNLLPIGTKVVITYPKCDEFNKEGTIVSYFEKQGSYYWDYMIRLEDGTFIYKDKPFVELI